MVNSSLREGIVLLFLKKLWSPFREGCWQDGPASFRVDRADYLYHFQAGFRPKYGTEMILDNILWEQNGHSASIPGLYDNGILIIDFRGWE